MPYTDSSYDEKVPSVSYTRICRRCGAIQYDSIWGCDNIDKESLSTPE
jgi:NMD protein affecting ribosome stability and mRNA decay